MSDIDKTEWRLFERRSIFNVLVPCRVECENEDICEIFIASKQAGYIPQEITVCRKNNISLTSIDCRPEEDISGKVLCAVSRDGRQSNQWYSLDGKNLGRSTV